MIKIFNLESKINLTVWSLVLGVIVTWLINRLTFTVDVTECNAFLNLKITDVCPQVGWYGLPFKIYFGYWSIPEVSLFERYKPLFNYIFWIAIVLMVFSLLSYLKNKNAKTLNQRNQIQG